MPPSREVHRGRALARIVYADVRRDPVSMNSKPVDDHPAIVQYRLRRRAEWRRYRRINTHDGTMYLVNGE